MCKDSVSPIHFFTRDYYADAYIWSCDLVGVVVVKLDQGGRDLWAIADMGGLFLRVDGGFK